uniref:Uncharacterized protein n=1 Tax=Arundo donax TaxID=35708 RepID=A0A0A9D8A6_ARUDO
MCEAQLGFTKYTILPTQRVPARIIYALCVVGLQLKNHSPLVKKVWLNGVATLQVVKSMNKRRKV